VIGESTKVRYHLVPRIFKIKIILSYSYNNVLQRCYAAVIQWSAIVNNSLIVAIVATVIEPER